MVLAGGLLAPLGRLFVGAVYGIVEGTILRPFGLDVPGIVSFVLVSVVMSAASFAAGRRVGAIVAVRSVERQLGSSRLLYGIALVSGVAGVTAFAAAVP